MLLNVLAVVGLLAVGCRGADPGSTLPEAPRAEHSAPAGDRSSREVRYNLEGDERRGGHTLERHVGWSDDELRNRLRQERQISAASSYTDRATAELVVGLTLDRNRARLDEWLDREGRRPNLVLTYRGPPGESIGRSLRRGSRSVVLCSDALVVLRWDGGRSFYVLTSYPESRR